MPRQAVSQTDRPVRLNTSCVLTGLLLEDPGDPLMFHTPTQLTRSLGFFMRKKMDGKGFGGVRNGKQGNQRVCFRRESWIYFMLTRAGD